MTADDKLRQRAENIAAEFWVLPDHYNRFTQTLSALIAEQRAEARAEAIAQAIAACNDEAYLNNERSDYSAGKHQGCQDCAEAIARLAPSADVAPSDTVK